MATTKLSAPAVRVAYVPGSKAVAKLPSLRLNARIRQQAVAIQPVVTPGDQILLHHVVLATAQASTVWIGGNEQALLTF